MLTHDDIVRAVNKVAPNHPVKWVAYFGSYANGDQTEDSDLDLLVEFVKPNSYLNLISFKHNMEDELEVSVDVVSMPIVSTSYLEIEREVPVYGQERQDFA